MSDYDEEELFEILNESISISEEEKGENQEQSMNEEDEQMEFNIELLESR